MAIKTALIALALVGAASSTEAGAWKAPRLPRPKMRKLEEDDCVPGSYSVAAICEEGVVKSATYAGATCAGAPVQLMDYPEFPCMPIPSPVGDGSSFSYGGLICVDDVPYLSMKTSGDCTGECAFTGTTPSLTCHPTDCDEGDEDDGEDDGEGGLACMASCPPMTGPDFCAYTSSTLATSASCIEPCVGSPEELAINMVLSSCGHATIGNSSCTNTSPPPPPAAAATNTSPPPPASASAENVGTPPSVTGAAARVGATLGLCVAALAAVLA